MPPHPVGPLDGRVENIEDPFPRGARGLEHLIESVQPRNRFVKQTEIKQKANQLT